MINKPQTWLAMYSVAGPFHDVFHLCHHCCCCEKARESKGWQNQERREMEMCETDVSIESMSIADSHRRCILTITLWAPQCTAVCSVGGNLERCKIHFKGVHTCCLCLLQAKRIFKSGSHSLWIYWRGQHLLCKAKQWEGVVIFVGDSPIYFFTFYLQIQNKRESRKKSNIFLRECCSVLSTDQEKHPK